MSKLRDLAAAAAWEAFPNEDDVMRRLVFVQGFLAGVGSAFEQLAQWGKSQAPQSALFANDLESFLKLFRSNLELKEGE